MGNYSFCHLVPLERERERDSLVDYLNVDCFQRIMSKSQESFSIHLVAVVSSIPFSSKEKDSCSPFQGWNEYYFQSVLIKAEWSVRIPLNKRSSDLAIHHDKLASSL